MNRAYSQIQIKSVDEEERLISGTASTPSTDRMGDVVVPGGAKFAASIPLLLYHDTRQPVGTAQLTRTADGLTFRAKLPKIDEPGLLRERVAEAWLSLKHGLLRGASIGFRVLENGVEQLKSGGLKFTDFEILELSLVAVPANQDANISVIRSICASVPALLGTGQEAVVPPSAAVVAPVVKTARKGAQAMKTITERKAAFAAEKTAKVAALNTLMDGEDAGATLDPANQEQFDTLDAEIKSIDEHLSRLDTLERVNKAAAVEVKGMNTTEASVSRGGHVIRVNSPLPPGIELTRAVMCKARAIFSMRKGHFVDAVEIAKQQFPDYPRIQEYIKAAIPAGTTTHTAFAGPLADPTNLSSEFIDHLRPGTILGKIAGFTMVPFNVRVIAQTSGGNGYWVGEGAPKPLTGFSFQAFTHTYHKVAAISVITEELARFSSPSAESLVRNGLVKALIERLDIDFIDPAQAAVTGVNPASVTNGLTPLSSAGASADNIRTDIQNLIEQYLLNNQDVAGLVLVMPNTLALAASLLVNSLGQREFTDLTMNGGTLLGIPVVTSMYAANQSGSGNIVVAINAPDIFLSDDGQVTVDASGEASLEMLDNPTNNSATPTPTTSVSMWQTNSIALRAERFITWTKRRAQAVVLMDDVNWGSIGSPS